MRLVLTSITIPRPRYSWKHRHLANTSIRRWWTKKTKAWWGRWDPGSSLTWVLWSSCSISASQTQQWKALSLATPTVRLSNTTKAFDHTQERLHRAKSFTSPISHIIYNPFYDLKTKGQSSHQSLRSFKGPTWPCSFPRCCTLFTHEKNELHIA